MDIWYWINTILSQPDEVWSLVFGLAVTLAVMWGTEKLHNAVTAAGVLLIVALPFAPINVAFEWHYWLGVVGGSVLFGIYKIGPSDPIEGSVEK